MEKKPVEELSFEEALEELEDLTNRLARGEVTLKESVEGYRRGTALLKRCRGELDEARLTIERLDEENEASRKQTSSGMGDDFDEIGF